MNPTKEGRSTMTAKFLLRDFGASPPLTTEDGAAACSPGTVLRRRAGRSATVSLGNQRRTQTDTSDPPIERITMRIHAIQTGTVAVKTRQREGVGTGKRRFLNMLLDREWTAPLPIYAWVIEHAEGAIVIDTGETSRAHEPGYFPRWHPYYRSGLREWVQPEEEIGPQLDQIGISPGDVRAVVMTHLHTDHAGGLHHFPESEIFVSRTEWHQAIGLMGRMRGYLNDRFPDWLRPTLVDFAPEPYEVFPESFTLTTAGDVRLVPTPGHTPGQISVVIEDDGDARVFLAGDASY